MSFNKTRTLYLIYTNIVLYALCFQMQRPLEPYLVEKILKQSGDSGSSEAAKSYTQLQSFFGVVQMIGSLVSGPLLDRFGSRGGLAVNFICSALSYYLLSCSTTMDILYYSKIPTVFQAGYLCSQLAISQITAEGTERTSALGLLSTSYLVGNMIGPALGGILGANGDYFYGAKLAAIGSCFSCLLVFLIPLDAAKADMLSSNANSLNHSKNIGKPDNNTNTSITSNSNSKENSSNIFSWTVMLQAVWLFLVTKFISGFANALQGAVMPLILKNNFSLNEVQMGYTMSFMPMVNAGVGTALGAIVKALGGGMKAIFLCLMTSTTVNLVQAVIMLPAASDYVNFLSQDNSSKNMVLIYMFTQLLLSMPQFVLAATVTSESTARVDRAHQGTLLGLEHSIFAAVRIATPAIGQLVLTSGGVSGVSALCFAVYMLISLIWAHNKQAFIRAGDHEAPDSDSTTDQYKRK